MLISTSITLPDVQIYVAELYSRFRKPELLYHNLTHTKSVVKRSYEISSAYSLGEKDVFILVVAAWFHDTGQLFGNPLHHEKRSITLMKDFLEHKLKDTAIIDSIEDCILATKLTNIPTTFLQKIICDADTYNLGTEEFFTTDKLLKKEFELRIGNFPQNWDEMTLSLFEHHRFYTSYCQNLLNPGKQKNKKAVEARLQMNQ